MKYTILLLCGLCLAFTACGTSYHVAGTVTDTHRWETFYSCGKSLCPIVHHSFVVNGKEYQDDGDDVWTGDYVSFDYNTVWGVSHLHDSTKHVDDSWIWALLIIGGIVVLAGGVIGLKWYLDR